MLESTVFLSYKSVDEVWEHIEEGYEGKYNEHKQK